MNNIHAVKIANIVYSGLKRFKRLIKSAFLRLLLLFSGKSRDMIVVGADHCICSPMDSVNLILSCDKVIFPANTIVNIRQYKDKILSFGNISLGIIFVSTEKDFSFWNLKKEYLMMKKSKAHIVNLYIDNSNISERDYISQYENLRAIGFDNVFLLSQSNIYVGKRLASVDCDVVTAEYSLIGGKWRLLVARDKTSQPGVLLSQLLNELDVVLPSKWKHLKEYTLFNICARVAEVDEGSVFFFRQPLKHRNDSKRFIDLFYIRMAIKAYVKGSLFIISYKKLPKFIPHIVIKDTIEAHIKAIDWYRKIRNPQTTTIGITGSIGKTSTKEMLYCVLSEKYETQCNPRNSNVQAKIGINMQDIRETTEYYIQEIGGGRPGGASRHSRMISPKIAVVTNVGTAHIGNFSSQEELLKNKLAITEGLSEDGVLFLNGDDSLLKDTKTKFKQIFFALDNKNADFYADNIVLYATHSEFDLVDGENRYAVKINVPGRHNVLNAVCCFAISQHIGMNPGDAVAGMEKFKTSGSRQNIISLGKQKIIADCFNASYESVRSSLEALNSISPEGHGRKIVFIGEITGLGSDRSNIYEQLADMLDNCAVDIVVYYSNDIGAKLPPFKNKDKVTIVFGEEKLIRWAKENVEKNDVLLFKGSSKVKLDDVIDTLFGTNLSDERYLDESKFEIVEKGGESFYVFEDYATLISSVKRKETLSPSKKIYGRKVKKLADGVFSYRKDLLKIKLHKHILHIGKKAFYHCSNIVSIDNATSVKYIDDEAFFGNTSLTNFDMGEDLIYIGKSAFEGCSSIKDLTIPASVLYIGQNAFKDCQKIEEIVVEGSPLIADNAFANCENIKITYK